MLNAFRLNNNLGLWWRDRVTFLRIACSYSKIDKKVLKSMEQMKS